MQKETVTFKCWSSLVWPEEFLSKGSGCAQAGEPHCSPLTVSAAHLGVAGILSQTLLQKGKEEKGKAPALVIFGCSESRLARFPSEHCSPEQGNHSSRELQASPRCSGFLFARAQQNAAICVCLSVCLCVPCR